MRKYLNFKSTMFLSILNSYLKGLSKLTMKYLSRVNRIIISFFRCEINLKKNNLRLLLFYYSPDDKQLKVGSALKGT